MGPERGGGALVAGALMPRPPSPRLTVIVVKKRVNARFFAQSGGRLQNPLPGTVIDVEVTRPEW